MNHSPFLLSCGPSRRCTQSLISIFVNLNLFVHYGALSHLNSFLKTNQNKTTTKNRKLKMHSVYTRRLLATERYTHSSKLKNLCFCCFFFKFFFFFHDWRLYVIDSRPGLRSGREADKCPDMTTNLPCHIVLQYSLAFSTLYTYMQFSIHHLPNTL